ncbi:MAG TPA: crosslink repair DNA glycosylase YcaQ family protein [Thermoplasmata archaeon]|nr:crosslink repair DNA glycosylase YcaQ family protein [Thermoplasmata archaeon]
MNSQSPGRTLETDLAPVRRLIVTKQHLAGSPKGRSGEGALRSVVQDLGYVQWDPVAVVAPSHLLTFWNRVDDLRVADVDRLLWKERRWFLCYAHAAAIVQFEDYPIFRSLMDRYPESLSSSWGAWRRHARRWIPAHRALRRKVLRELEGGPRRIDQFADHARTGRASDGWSSGSDVSEMLFHLQMRGEVAIVGRDGNQNVWGLAAPILPSWVERRALSPEEAERAGAVRALRAMGVATRSEINFYFLRGQYQHLRETLAGLLDDETIVRVRIDGVPEREERYIHRDDVALLESLGSDDWQPRMSLLSPFDNLTCARERTNRLFGFDHFTEMYVPEAKRRWGYYVLPILWGDRFVGRIDPQFDREHRVFRVRAVHAEPGATRIPGLGPRLRETIDRLGAFLGAREVAFSSRVPSAWKTALR